MLDFLGFMNKCWIFLQNQIEGCSVVCEWDASRQKSKKGSTGKSEKEKKKERKKKKTERK